MLLIISDVVVNIMLIPLNDLDDFPERIWEAVQMCARPRTW